MSKAKATNPKALGMNPTAYDDNPELFHAKFGLMGFIDGMKATLTAVKNGQEFTQDGLENYIEDCEKAKENAQEVFRNTL